MPRRTLATALMLLVGAALMAGCQVGALVGAMAQAHEDQKKIEVLAKYSGLEGKRTAVVVDADLGVLFEFPTLAKEIMGGVSARLQANIEGISVIHPDAVDRWQWSTPQWNALEFSEMGKQLNVERIVFIEVYEFRLNPAGNRWIWDGVCAANVGVIECDGGAPDILMEQFDVTERFPEITGVTRDQATDQQIRHGVLAKFTQRTSWLFYTHIEPKYPDRYRPELDQG